MANGWPGSTPGCRRSGSGPEPRREGEAKAASIYDDPGFFAGYSALPRSVAGLEGAPEWPALRTLLPPMPGLRVLDLGCGFGWFCRWARGAGAGQVIGLDLSARMLGRARAMTDDPGIAWLRADLAGLPLAPARFDLAWSSLAFHYVKDLAGLLAAVHRVLRPGGRLVASLEHPVFTAPRRPGWRQADFGGWHWPLDGYGQEGQRAVDWLGARVVKQHRTLGTLLNTLLRAGFVLDHVEDWVPTEAAIAARPELAKERERPIFLLLAAHRPG
ncbi:class I SAM-dependent methyltransferase [Paracraurococcus ruber]|uniref:SAM-dependent methyltransferase n=1 Tax=Paracraurococcus ruber TaxID=77675 RepID=A0ABS1CZJ5_9PROT|nr:class I SAM-dependent methyltransferase [Paracraurococcus ruber]MBK1659104.1 SAM-dependent methyltransferase [Paracraurococcus ruber]TDG29856.1 class I SAM-dependent methyltransferase [Paracraurococcus ruber]